MIEYRYQYRAKEGIVWTPWKVWKYSGTLESLRKKFPWQEKNKLKNEFREV